MESEINELTEKELDDLGKMLINTVKASELTDGELLDEVCVHCQFDVCSYPEALIDELTARFQKRIGLDTTPKGMSIITGIME